MRKITARDQILNTFGFALLLGYLTLSAMGCRIGNRVASTPSADPLTGYYGTEPQALKFCVGGEAAKCVTSRVSEVPSLVARHLTSPVAFIVENFSTGEAVLTAYNGEKSAIPVWIDSDNRSLFYINSFSPQSLWRSSACNTHLFLEETGELVSGESMSVPNSTRKTLGRVTLKITLTYSLEDTIAGACHDTLTAMSQCYNDVTRCGGADAAQNLSFQLDVKNLLGPYITSQALSPADISKISSFAYEVEYR